LNGTAWLDANFNKIADSGEPLLQGWTVGLYLNGVVVQAVLTDVNGVYRFSSVPPTDGTANRYELRFTAPGAGPNTAKLGKADSAFTNLLQRITDIAVPSGSNLQNLNLPIGRWRRLQIFDARSHCGRDFEDATRQHATAGNLLRRPRSTGPDYSGGRLLRFDVNFSDPACPAGGSYLIVVLHQRRTT